MIGDQFFDACGFDPVAVCETNNISATRSMVAQNAGVAFISESCLSTATTLPTTRSPRP